MITIHKIDLFTLAKESMEEYLCRQITDERFIYDAYCYAEHRGNEYDLAFQIKDDWEDLIWHDRLSEVLEDYCIYVLARKPEPMEFIYSSKRLRTKYYYG